MLKNLKNIFSYSIVATLILSIILAGIISSLIGINEIYANPSGSFVHELFPANLPNQVQSDNTGMLWFDYAGNANNSNKLWNEGNRQHSAMIGLVGKRNKDTVNVSDSCGPSYLPLGRSTKNMFLIPSAARILIMYKTLDHTMTTEEEKQYGNCCSMFSRITWSRSCFL